MSCEEKEEIKKVSLGGESPNEQSETIRKGVLGSANKVTDGHHKEPEGQSTRI